MNHSVEFVALSLHQANSTSQTLDPERVTRTDACRQYPQLLEQSRVKFRALPIQYAAEVIRLAAVRQYGVPGLAADSGTSGWDNIDTL